MVRLALALSLLTFVGCAPGAYFGRETVAQDVAGRTGYVVAQDHGQPPSACTPDVNLADGLTEDEASLLALERNPRFQELLGQLGITWAELMRARQLANPELSVLFPVGPKQLEFTLMVPLEFLLQRPRRIAMAEIESRRVAQELVQEALNTILAARQAHADVLLAQERLAFVRQSLDRRAQLARQAEAGLKAGEVSQLDVAAASLFHQRGQTDLRRTAQDVDLARQRLATVLGLDCLNGPVIGEAMPALAVAPPNVCDLVNSTLASRPDLIAAANAVATAEERARLARYDYLVFQGFLPDYNDKGEKGAEAGPGLNVTLPIFHQNQAAIARAEAEAGIARRRFLTLRATAVQEIWQSHGRLIQARDEWHVLHQQIEPRAISAYQAATRAYVERATTLPLVLELVRALDEVQARRLEVFGEMRRAAAELERNAGGRLTLAPPPPPSGLISTAVHPRSQEIRR
jgi:cobalt-zinc-cadmium efflux system outer membrane protein